MSELNEFLKVLAEAKKEKKEHIEEAKKDMDGFFEMVSQVKAADPKHQMMKKVKQQVQEDITTLFSQLSKAKAPITISDSAEQHIDNLVESVQLINEIESNVVGEFVVQEGKFVDPVTLTELVVPEVKPASEVYTKAEIDDLLKHNASFQQPDPKLVDANMGAVQQKLKFLEQAIGKIAATGPGSGEVNFRWLDDVNRSTMAEANDSWVLEYDAATKKVQFTENVGPIRTLKFNTTGPQTDLIPGQIAWNASEDCIDIHHADGSTLQGGLEQHIRVFNNGEDTLTQGTFVGFGGVVLDGDELPVAVRYTATATAMPLYIMGVLTGDVPPGGIGRCTVFGKVRTLDTTGDSGLGETWAQGDLLWAHPSMPGRLTKHQPTAPYPAISVAAVLRSDATNGVLLVRPTIFPRLWFGRFRDFTNQHAVVINTPYAVMFGQTALSSGFHIDPTHTSRVVAEFTGLYKFDPRLQFTSSNSSNAKIWVWYRVNGVDAVGTGTQYTIQSNGGIVVVTLPYIVSLQANDYFELMWAVDSVNVSLMSPAATSFAPATPGAVVAVTQANL